jgi:hypothetical protein
VIKFGFNIKTRSGTVVDNPMFAAPYRCGIFRGTPPAPDRDGVCTMHEKDWEHVARRILQRADPGEHEGRYPLALKQVPTCH